MKGIKRINSFLVEIIVVLLFFSLSATIILQVFVATHKKEQQSLDINRAVILTQKLTEEYRANADANSWCDNPETQGDSTVYTLFYDSEWAPSDGADSAYKVVFTVNESLSDAGTNCQTVAELFALQNSEPKETVYTLSSQHYLPKK